MVLAVAAVVLLAVHIRPVLVRLVIVGIFDWVFMATGFYRRNREQKSREMQKKDANNQKQRQN